MNLLHVWNPFMVERVLEFSSGWCSGFEEFFEVSYLFFSKFLVCLGSSSESV